MKLHRNEFINEKINQKVADYCYRKASEYWERAKESFKKDPNSTPLVYYSSLEKGFVFLDGFEDSLEKIFDLDDRINEHEFVVVESLNFIEYKDRIGIHGEDYIKYRISRDLEKGIEKQIEKTKYHNFQKDADSTIKIAQGLAFVCSVQVQEPSYPQVIVDFHNEVVCLFNQQKPDLHTVY